MPIDTRFSTATADAQTDVVTARLDDGYLQIYEGDRPADGDAPSDGSVLLAEVRFADPAFGPSVNGTAWANPLTVNTAINTGQAQWLRTLQVNHSSVVFDGNVGTADSNLNLDRVFIQQGANVIIEDFSYSSPKV